MSDQEERLMAMPTIELIKPGEERVFQDFSDNLSDAGKLSHRILQAAVDEAGRRAGDGVLPAMITLTSANVAAVAFLAGKDEQMDTIFKAMPLAAMAEQFRLMATVLDRVREEIDG